MLIVFKSKASGDVMMFGDVALQLLDTMGKGREKQGIVTVEQMPDAIRRLKQMAAQSKAGPDEIHDKTNDEPTDSGDQRRVVSLAVRAVPLIELLERSLKARTPVTWGV